jgi:hypothetical protein
VKNHQSTGVAPQIGARGVTARWVAAFAASLLLVGGANAQTAAGPDSTARAHAEASQVYGDPVHPNISGIWLSGAANYSWLDYSKSPDIPLKPKYAQIFQHTRDMAAKGAPIADPVGQCLAFGMPRFTTMDFTVIQTPGRITMYTEVLHEIREVYMDGRPVPKDWDPTWGGRSNGRWEGDTLVIETTGMKAGMADQVGLPYSEQLKVVERIRRDGDVLTNETTLTDPEVYTRPFSTVHRWRLAPAGYEFGEYICSENQRNAPDAEGVTTVERR